MRRAFLILWAAVAVWGPAGPSDAAETDPPASDGETVVLDTASFWRVYLVRGSDLVRTAEGKQVFVSEITPARRVKVEGKYRDILNATEKVIRVPSPPPAGWARAAFDDSAWGRFRGPFGGPTWRNSIRLRPGAVLLCCGLLTG